MTDLRPPGPIGAEADSLLAGAPRRRRDPALPAGLAAAVAVVAAAFPLCSPDISGHV